MPTIRFTDNIQRHIECPPRAVRGRRVRDALDAYFAEHPRARGYVLDERGQLRKHVCIFADGKRLPHGAALTHAIRPDPKLYVMQALSGG